MKQKEVLAKICVIHLRREDSLVAFIQSFLFVMTFYFFFQLFISRSLNSYSYLLLQQNKNLLAYIFVNDTSNLFVFHLRYSLAFVKGIQYNVQSPTSHLLNQCRLVLYMENLDI